MLKRLFRRAPALLLCALLSTVAVAACNGSSTEGAGDRTATSRTGPTAPTSVTATIDAIRTIEVGLVGGQVQGGRRTEKVELGEQIRIRATSDVAEELHVHTYDRRAALRPSQPAEVVFTADIPGRHEVEFEHSGRHALTLEVS